MLGEDMRRERAQSHEDRFANTLGAGGWGVVIDSDGDGLVTPRPAQVRQRQQVPTRGGTRQAGTLGSQIRTAIGTLIWVPAPNSRRRSESTSAGAVLPNRTPKSMHAPTHRVRYRSK